MSETSMLISCTGKITRAELAHVPTPPATASHIPIPHAAVVEALFETLSHRQISVVDVEFALSKDGMEMFGVLDQASRSASEMRTTSDSDWCARSGETSCVATSPFVETTPPRQCEQSELDPGRATYHNVLSAPPWQH